MDPPPLKFENFTVFSKTLSDWQGYAVLSVAGVVPDKYSNSTQTTESMN